MKSSLLVRRIHLYSGLFLLIFFTRFGISAIPFSHNTYFNEKYKDKPQWNKRFEQSYDRPVPEDADLRRIGAQILKDVGMEGAFGAYKPNKKQLNIHRYDFWSTARLSYYIDENRLVVEDKNFRWDHFLQTFHWRGGFQQDSLLHDFWGVTVDVVCIGILVWIVTGIIMWWQIGRTRTWGIIAVCGGFLTFIFFIAVL